MKKDDFSAWLSSRMATQKKLAVATLVAMTLLGLFAILVEGGLIYLILSIGFVGRVLAALLTIAISGTVLFGTWFRLPVNLADTVHQVDLSGREYKLVTAPTMTAVWTYAFGTIETDRNFAERLLAWLSLPQRLLCAAWYVWQRIDQLQNVNVVQCAEVIRILYRKAERVTADYIAEKKPDLNLPRTIREVSLIDGVVFLTRRDFGLSLATRLTDELNEWKSSQSSNAFSGTDED